MKNLIEGVGRAKSKAKPNKIKKGMICILMILSLGVYSNTFAGDPIQATAPIQSVDKFLHLNNDEIKLVTMHADMLPLLTNRTQFNVPIFHAVKISSGFGERSDPCKRHTVEKHKGVDLPFPRGTDILAPASGVVTFSGWRNGYGNVVEIDHGNGFTSLFAHNSVNLVKLGQHIEFNSVIGKVGSTGKATGPHVHLEMRFHGDLIDPTDFVQL